MVSGVNVPRIPAEPSAVLAALRPATALLPCETPLHPLPRISEELGREVWVKRDDLTAVGVGGNKIRKLELLLAEALDQGADTLVTVGAAQSNHARATAAVAAMAGLRCHLVLGGEEPDTRTGNLLLDDLLGASLEYVPAGDWATLFAAAQTAVERLRDAGRNPYLMPVGGSTPLGSLGFAAGYAEFALQAAELGLDAASIVLANGSAGTQAGMLAGQAALAGRERIVGVAVALESEVISPLTDGLAGEAARLLESRLPESAPVSPTSAVVLDGYRGAAYGQPTQSSEDAMRVMLRREGILLDPVYTAKAFAAVLRSDPSIPPGPVVFWHTGGMPAVFAASH